jgi:hypothetical protein
MMIVACNTSTTMRLSVCVELAIQNLSIFGNSVALFAVAADEPLRLPSRAGKAAAEQKQLYAKDLERRLR